MPNMQPSAAEMYSMIVDPRSINQIMRDGGLDDAEMAKLWRILGIPIMEGVRQSLSLPDLFQRLIGAALASVHPYAVKIDRTAFDAWLEHQKFTPAERIKILTAMGWNEADGKVFAALLTRLCKSVIDPEWAK